MGELLVIPSNPFYVLKKKFCVSQLLGGGQDQSCENSQLFFSNESFPKTLGMSENGMGQKDFKFNF